MSVDPTYAWIDASNSTASDNRRLVRSQAARSSAASRIATVHKKRVGRNKHVGTHILEPVLTTDRRAKKHVRALPSSSQVQQSAGGSPTTARFPALVDVVTTILARSPPISRGETSLAHGSFRSMLWDAFTVNTTLWHVALFIAGTHSNTCGLPHSALQHLGAGLVVLRGASLDAIQQKMDASEPTTPIGVALLAGWEKRFGDAQAYDIHMQAWKAMTIPGMSLDERNVATLTQLTMDMYRTSLDTRAASIRSGQSARTFDTLASLPSGFHMISTERAEARSLLLLTARLAQYNPIPRQEVARLRRLCLENLAWGTSHTYSLEPNLAYESEHDPLELCALYHLRAANMSIVGVMLEVTLSRHNVVWNFDLRGGLVTHTASCVHLGTERLLGTQYQWVGLWARYSLCAVANDPSQNDFMIGLLQTLGILSRGQMMEVLGDHLYLDDILYGDFKRYWVELAGLSKGVLCNPGSFTLVSRPREED